MLNKVRWRDVKKFEMISKRVHMATHISNEMMKKKENSEFVDMKAGMDKVDQRLHQLNDINTNRSFIFMF